MVLFSIMYSKDTKTFTSANTKNDFSFFLQYVVRCGYFKK